MRVRTRESFRRGAAIKINGSVKTPFTSSNTSIGFRQAVQDEHPFKSLQRRRKGMPKGTEDRKDPLISSGAARLHNFWTHRITGWSSTSEVQFDNTPSGWAKPIYRGELASFCMGDTTISACMPAGNSWYDPLVSVSAINPYRDFVLAKAFSAIREADVQLANYVIELPQLISSLANPFQLLYKFGSIMHKWYKKDGLYPILCPDGWVRHFSRPNKVFSPKKLSKTSLREASNRWLELQFGLLPAWDDTMGIIEEIDNLIETEDKVNFGKGGYRDNQQKVAGRGFTNIYDATIHYTWQYERYSSYTSKVYFKHLVEMGRMSRMGLTPNNIFDILWEATPWSFVVDWVYGIGDWLHTLQKLPQVHLYGNYVTRIDTIKLFVRLTHAQFVSYIKPANGTYVYRNVSRGRTVNHTLPAYPQPNLRWFNVTRSLNALSLVIQKLTRGK